MALIKCPKCESEVSDTERICPNCKIVLRENSKGPIIFLFVAISIFITVLLCVAFYMSNTKGMPKDMDTDTYNLGVSALSITDDFIDTKITLSEAQTKLESITSSLNQLYVTNNNKFTLSVKADIISISTSLQYNSIYKYTSSTVTEKRNFLAREIHKDLR